MAEGYINLSPHYNNIRIGIINPQYTTVKSGYSPTLVPVTFSQPMENTSYDIFFSISPGDAWNHTNLSYRDLATTGFTVVIDCVSSPARTISNNYINWIAILRH